MATDDKTIPEAPLGEESCWHLGKPCERTQTLARLNSLSGSAASRVVFSNGCFDILHVGHVKLLEEARLLGDLLVVGLNSDESVRRLKGPQRPINPQADRAALLSALRCVDYVVVFQEDTPLKLIRTIRPWVIVKGADYSADQVVGREFVESYGGRVHLAQLEPNRCTTSIVRRLAALDELRLHLSS